MSKYITYLDGYVWVIGWIWDFFCVCFKKYNNNEGFFEDGDGYTY